MKITRYTLNFLAAILCLFFIGAALVLQHVYHLKPCPLCIIQRILFIALGLTFLITLLHRQSWYWRSTNSIAGFIALLGTIIAGRQVWLQHLPPEAKPLCGPGLSYMLDNFPLTQTIPMVFKGSGDCAEVQWQLFSLSIPEWGVIFFSLFFILAVGQLFHRE